MKKLLCTSLTVALLLGGVTAAFAAETPKTAAVASSDTTTTSTAVSITSDTAISNVVPDMNFTGTPIQLSLDAAYKKILNDSPGKTLADYNKKNTQAISEGYLETVQSINQGIAAGEASKKTRDIQRTLRDYAGSQAEPNYQAELNKLKVDTLTNYYQLKQLEDLEKIAQETLTLKEKLLSNTQLKYKLGTVPNSDVLEAQNAVNKAKDDLFVAQNNFRNKKMAFNTFMGYKLMQNVTLTNNLSQVSVPAKSLESSIKEALANRNEIKAAEFGLKFAKLDFDAIVNKFSKSSSTYIKKQLSIAEAEKNLNDAYNGIEMDVRSKYMDMQQKYAAITTGNKTVENAKEAVRLTQLQYDAGMTTLTTVNEVQIAYNQSQIALSNNLLDYNLAVEAYNYASGVGTTAATIN